LKKVDFTKEPVMLDHAGAWRVYLGGRSIRAALSAINSFGRPSQIELLVLIDRRFSRELPIQPDYRGIQVDVVEGEKVVVDLTEDNERVYLSSQTGEKPQ